MNPRTLMFIPAMTLFALLTIPTWVSAQEQAKEDHHVKHHHYKLMDMGTFGGPQAFTQDAPQFLTNRGVVVGWADTTTPDPYYPNTCFFCILQSVHHPRLSFPRSTLSYGKTSRSLTWERWAATRAPGFLSIRAGK